MGVAKNGQHERKSKASQRSSADTKRKLSFGDYRFTRIELTADEKQQYKDDVQAGDWTPPAMDEYTNGGYTIKYSTDKNGHGCICTISCVDVDSGDAGLQLSGRASTASAAYSVCTYKDRVICGTRSWAEAESERGGSYDEIG